MGEGIDVSCESYLGDPDVQAGLLAGSSGLFVPQ